MVKIFEAIARFQSRFYIEIIILAIIVTVFLGFNSVKVEFEPDISKEMPTNKQVFKDTEYFHENFKGSDIVLVTFEIDRTISDNPIKKITEKEVVESIYKLDGYIRELKQVQDTQNLGAILKRARMYPASEKIINDVFDNAPVSKFISKDKKSSLFIIFTDKLTTRHEIDSFVNTVEDKIKRSEIPFGIKTRVSGNPSLKASLHKKLQSDYFFTIIIALLLITSFLAIMMRRIKSTFLILSPIIVGLVWYAGFIHILDMKLSISTIATGAMVVGLGVEYSIFIYNKMEKAYLKKKEKNEEKALLESVGFTGRAIFGSALTTTAAFLSLTLSSIPLLSHVGLISAIGIMSIAFNAVFITPCMFIIIEKIFTKND
ncbi:MAG: MMPL family transporter [Nanobdellota archaeon]